MDEWSRRLRTASADTHYLEAGEGPPVVFLHGSGPGVSALANWRFTIPALAPAYRCLAPDLVGFGKTAAEGPVRADVWTWAEQVRELLDGLAVERAHVVGNSMGGAIALAFAVRYPDRVDRLVTMGTLGVPFPITDVLDEVWGYRPDMEGMRRIISKFAWDQRYAEDEALVRLRYETSLDPSVRERYEALFPAPRQRAVDAAVIDEADLRRLRPPLLAIHGRDDRVIPLETSLRVADLVPDSRLAIFPRCGHWVQIERRVEFPAVVGAFLGMGLDPAPPAAG
jgi:pimeloyl-ACP methyl ester carboxylesterase